MLHVGTFSCSLTNLILFLCLQFFVGGNWKCVSNFLWVIWPALSIFVLPLKFSTYLDEYGIENNYHFNFFFYYYSIYWGYMDFGNLFLLSILNLFLLLFSTEWNKGIYHQACFRPERCKVGGWCWWDDASVFIFRHIFSCKVSLWRLYLGLSACYWSLHYFWKRIWFGLNFVVNSHFAISVLYFLWSSIWVFKPTG